MTIIITRGYPGSGKTTWALEWIKSQPDAKRARVNRDVLRAEMFGAEGVLAYEQEQEITKLQREQVVRLVKSGYDVVVDDTNLKAKYARAWADLAVELGVDFDVLDFKIPADQCKRRDFERGVYSGGRYVGGKVIDGIAARFPTDRWPEIVPSEKAATRAWPAYVPDTSLPAAYIVDIDGTIAAKRMGPGERGWHEYHRVGEDEPKPRVIEVINRLVEDVSYGMPEPLIIFVSGRKDSCRAQTRLWLQAHVGRWTDACLLFMRDSKDNRADDIVKNEIFEEAIAPNFNVLATFDDRQRVVDMWRAKGITCFQVDAWTEAGQ